MAMRLVSVIIVTFNSARTLPFVLASIRKQSYPKRYIETLIIDGGSTDSTLSIAKKYGSRIIHNPRVEPLYARYLGYMQAKGNYIMYLDHDEVMVNPGSLKERVKVFRNNPRVKAITGNGYRSPKGYGFINKYINEFGDPFSFFIYRMSKHADFFLEIMRRRYSITRETSAYAVFDLSSSPEVPIIELAAGGGMFDANFFKKTFPKIKTYYHLLPHLLHMLRQRYPCIAIMKNDAVLHYSSDNFNSYCKKIIWRIKNNIFYTQTVGASGFTGRQQYHEKGKQWRKYLFIPYALTLILPVFDALYLMFSRKDMTYAFHVPLTVMTAVFILYFLTLKALGIRPSFMSYDGSVRAYEKN